MSSVYMFQIKTDLRTEEIRTEYRQAMIFDLKESTQTICGLFIKSPLYVNYY